MFYNTVDIKDALFLSLVSVITRESWSSQWKGLGGRRSGGLEAERGSVQPQFRRGCHNHQNVGRMSCLGDRELWQMDIKEVAVLKESNLQRTQTSKAAQIQHQKDQWWSSLSAGIPARLASVSSQCELTDSETHDLSQALPSLVFF